MIRRHPRSTRTYTLFPYATLFRSDPVEATIVWSQGKTFGLQFNKKIDPSQAVAPSIERKTVTYEAPTHFRPRSEEHTSEFQSLMRISFAVICLKKKQTMMVRLTTD